MEQNENVFTIGYEGSNIEDFIATLLLFEIETLVDIRDLPLSRKKGFSKNQLSELLETNGINYIHLKGLGDPKEGREAARSGEHDKFVKIFSTHMDTEKAKEDLGKAIDISSSSKSCFLCFEREPKYCHRNIVIKKIAQKTKQNISHLGVQSEAKKKVTLRIKEYEYA